jgi:hypothetical protein
MPHRQPTLLAIGRDALLRTVLLALLAAMGCRGDRSRVPQVDTTMRKKGVEVLASPQDSALRHATAALDSAEQSFARARASLDSEALALRGANRLDSAYALRYVAFERRRAEAARLRSARDRARRVRDSLAARISAPPTGKR